MENLEQKKIFFIIEDRPEIRLMLVGYFEMVLSQHFIVKGEGTYESAKAFAFANMEQISVILFDGELDGGQLSFPIAVELRKRGFTGLMFLISGKAMSKVVPPKDARWVFNGVMGKPFGMESFASQLQQEWLG